MSEPVDQGAATPVVGQEISWRMVRSGRLLTGVVVRVKRTGTIWADAGYRSSFHDVKLVDGEYISTT